jgi:hypothetical protein
MPTEVIILPVMCAMVFGIVYVVISARHRERMAMIEKGADPSLFARKAHSSNPLAFGLLMAGLGIGLGIGWTFDAVVFGAGVENPLPYFISILFFGGLALLQYHRIIRREHRG